MSISEISLYKALRTKLGDETADELVEFVKTQMQSELKARTDTFLTKQDKVELLEKINDDKNELLQKMSGDKSELLQKMSNDKSELLQMINNNKVELIDRIHKAKTETIIWIVGIGVLQFILGILAKNFL